MRGRVRNAKIREELESQPILVYMEERRVRRWGDLRRMKDACENVWEDKVFSHDDKGDRGRLRKDWNIFGIVY